MKMNAQLNMKLYVTPNQLMEDCLNTTLESEDKQTIMEHLKHHPFQLVEYLGWQVLVDQVPYQDTALGGQVPHQAIAHHLLDQVLHQGIAHHLEV